MNSDLIEAQLTLLLVAQPERLCSHRLKAELFSKPYDEVFIGLRKAYIDGEKPSLSIVEHAAGISDEARTLIARLKAYEPPEVGFDYAVSFLEEKSLRSAFSVICRSAYDQCHDRTRPIREAISSTLAKATSLVTTGETQTQEGSSFDGISKIIKQRNEAPGKLLGPSLGFPELDKTINGFRPRFYLLGARPSVGKTALIGNFVESLCEAGEKCVIYTPEMTADEYRERVLAGASGVNISAYRESPMTVSELALIHKAMRRMKSWRWWINDDPDITIEQIEAEVTALVSAHGKVNVFIDYLQLVGCDGSGDRFEKVGRISSGCKKLSKRLGIAVMAAAQLRRIEGRFDKNLSRTVQPEPQLDGFRESGNLEQDADVALLLHRDHIYDPDVAKLIVGKQRAGKTHQGINLTYHKTVTKFYEK